NPVVAQVSLSFSEPKATSPRVPPPSATNPEGSVRLACVRPAASVRSEPGSNSQVELTANLSFTARRKRPGRWRSLHSILTSSHSHRPPKRAWAAYIHGVFKRPHLSAYRG